MVLTPPGAPSGPDTSSLCGSTDPCVLTGQYNQHRNSTNKNAGNLGGMANSGAYSTFGLAYLYAVTNPALGKNNEPVIAQPLYVTNVTTNLGSSPNCNTTACNILVVATLSDTVYAFDTGIAPNSSGAGNMLWHTSLVGHCGANGAPFNNMYNGFPGPQNLGYYGAVATPVIDTASGVPTAFVVSGCVNAQLSPKTIQWFIDVTTGGSVGSFALTDSVDTFNAQNQIARASLLLTHPANGLTYVYVTFGDGVREIGAEDNSGGSSYRYTGAEFVLKYMYSSQSFVFANTLKPAFETTCTKASGCTSTNLFPAVWTGTDNNYPNGGPAGPGPFTGCQGACCAAGTCCVLPTPLPPQGTGQTTSNCSTGSNWAANGGGCWMSSRGPASSGNADVLLACGNGAFACASTGQGQTGCLTVGGVTYWGQSAIELPAGNQTSPTAPLDFYAPNQQNYTCTTPSCTPSWDPSPAPYETEELSRVDQDFGTGGMVVIPQPNVNFVVTADKAGFVYVMPPPSGETSGSSLGEFQGGDAGLTGAGLSLNYETQAPFRASRLPDATNPPQVCPTVNINGQIGSSTASCDEIHEIAYEGYDNLIFMWPSNETVMTYQGTFSAGTPTEYSFAGRISPCTGTALYCTSFPQADPASAGGAMAVAIDQTTTTGSCTAGMLPCIALWSVVPQPNNNNPQGSGPIASLGSLYAYNVSRANLPNNPLTHVWDSTEAACGGPNTPTIASWFSTAFTEPSLADITESSTKYGAVYVPMVCAVTSGGPFKNCGSAETAAASGVLVFARCP